MQTIDYIPLRGDLKGWGDERANRSDRFLACVAYLDGVHPSVVMCRGYYTRTVLAALDWNGKELKIAGYSIATTRDVRNMPDKATITSV